MVDVVKNYSDFGEKNLSPNKFTVLRSEAKNQYCFDIHLRLYITIVDVLVLSFQGEEYFIVDYKFIN